MFLMVSACDEPIEKSVRNYTSVKYGTSFGECMGYCIAEIELVDSKIEFKEQGWELAGELPVNMKSENVNPAYWSTLISSIEFESFEQLDSVIGCPDCADGGSEWIEITKDGQTHRVVFEYWNEPKELYRLVRVLRTYINAFQVANNENRPFNERVLIEQVGFIKNFVATRGVNQYLVGVANDIDTTFYFGNYMEEGVLQDGLGIKFNAVLLNDSTVISKPSANDIPIADFSVQNMNVFHAEVFEN